MFYLSVISSLIKFPVVSDKKIILQLLTSNVIKGELFYHSKIF
jgi:hypothetical protein